MGGYSGMKDLRMLVWLTQLGLSTALPLACMVLLGVWLHKSIGWGVWTVWAGVALGIYMAVAGFRDSMRAMKLMSRDDKQQPPPVAFNQHD